MFQTEYYQKPWLEIIEQPMQRGYRFRYKSEGSAHGSIPGASSEKSKPTYPAVKLHGYHGYAKIVVQLVTNQDEPQIHPNCLVGRYCENGICTVPCGPKDMIATFTNLGIQQTPKNKSRSNETFGMQQLQQQNMAVLHGMWNDNNVVNLARRNSEDRFKDENRKCTFPKAQNGMKSIDLSAVCLMFIAYRCDNTGMDGKPLSTVISVPVFNCNPLKICRIDRSTGSAEGGEEVFVLCTKIKKDNIRIKFFEEDEVGNVIWQDFGRFFPIDVHRQCAIVFKTPAYKLNNREEAEVNIQLCTNNDEEVSPPVKFKYVPPETDMIKRKKTKPAFPNYEGKQFPFEGNRFKRMAPIPKLPLPQNGPIEPSLLMPTHCPVNKGQDTIFSNPSHIAPSSFPARHEAHSINMPSYTYHSIPAPGVPSNSAQPSNYVSLGGSLPLEYVTSGNNIFQRQNILSTFGHTSNFSGQSGNSTGDIYLSQEMDSQTPPDNSVSSSDNNQSCVLASSNNDCNDEDILQWIDAHLESDAGPTRDSSFSTEDDDVNFASGFRYEEGTLEDDDDMCPSAETRLHSLQSDEMEYDTALLCHRVDKLSLHKESDVKKFDLKSDQQTQMRNEETNEVSAKVEKKTNSAVNLEENQKFTKILDKCRQTAVSKKWLSALHGYSATGDVRALLMLQSQLTNLHDENGDTAIHISVIYDQPVALSSLLDVVVTNPEPNSILDCVNMEGQTALHTATLTDNYDAVFRLLNAGSDPLITDKFGNNSIHVASRRGNAEVLRRLLNCPQIRGKSVDIQNNSGLGCFHLAAIAKGESSECLKLLNNHGFDVNLPDVKSGRTPLHLAAEKKNSVVAACLLCECDADVNASTYDGYTPLHLVAASSDCMMASFFLACGADPDMRSSPLDEQDDEGRKPIDLACSDKMREVLAGKPVSDSLGDNIVEDNYNVEDDLSTLDPLLKMQLCKLLNKSQSGSDWLALAEQLYLSNITCYLIKTPNPTNTLLENYLIGHGSVSGLRSALTDIGRHDAIQLLNRAQYKS